MKRLLERTLMIAIISLTACDDDEKPKTVPEVTTSAVTDVTTTSAMAGGEVTGDGNASVTVTGIVYSSASSEPTIVDDKIELTDTEGDFSALLEGLSSGTTYHVRAYATNSIGTGYGEVVDFTTGNAAPTVTDVSFAGEMEVNKELTATYTYEDAEGDVQSGTTFQWYLANDDDGGGATAIAGATESTYIIQEAQQDKYISVGVTPMAGTGTTTGAEVKSIFKGAVGEATTVTFMYNGQEVTYGIIYREATGKKWLDRNLGAANPPSSVSDFANYGDLFQWGRLADGHQEINRSGPNDADMIVVNGTDLALSSTDVPGHSKFIVTNGTAPNDWRSPQNNSLWQGVNGINNPCPTGWRLPTLAEFAAESITNLTDGFSKLKLTYTGNTAFASGAVANSSILGTYWTSTIAPTDATRSMRVILNPGYLETTNTRAAGMACRCIKE
jgi:hypothetical protein